MDHRQNKKNGLEDLCGSKQEKPQKNTNTTITCSCEEQWGEKWC
ncbi:hypothetical protein I656_01581 [Geobacillus sp. WSUCF1]|nr:hypothetical protein I656_01581 [Geobacillus sp. WSUCF1]